MCVLTVYLCTASEMYSGAFNILSSAVVASPALLDFAIADGATQLSCCRRTLFRLIKKKKKKIEWSDLLIILFRLRYEDRQLL